jgi:KDO2-lipid IV(A) lauroyltransferase
MDARAGRPALKSTQLLETLMVRGLASGVRRMPWRASLAFGAGLGACVGALGVRAAVARDNLARAFPERSESERGRILAFHYRELGRVACEYPRLAELARAPLGRYLAAIEGAEHLDAARAGGRGAILMTGHFGHFELVGAALGARHPTSFVVKPLGNPGVESLIARWRADAGIESIPIGLGVRRVFEALRENRWVAMLADQDARRRGIFVPFFGRPASTPTGPAELSLRSGAPIVMGFDLRGEDGRHTLHVVPPLPRPPADDPDPVRTLTAAHVATLEAWVRRHPERWFWLHRRWKTSPPAEAGGVAGEGGGA